MTSISWSSVTDNGYIADLDKVLHSAHGDDPKKVAEQEKEAVKNETEVKTPPSRAHLTECHLKPDDPGAPFCLPTQNMTWRVGETYDGMFFDALGVFHFAHLSDFCR